MKIFFVSLGCDKNLVDSEKMLGILSGKGYEFTDDEADADIIIINTCCFIGDAKEESISEIIRLGELKQSGKLKVLIAGGCLAQRYADEIFGDLPELDAVIGTMSIGRIAEVLDEVLENKSLGKEDAKVKEVLPLDTKPFADSHRSLTTGGHYAYLKIAEGCDKHCTYCIIPKVRGHYRSFPKERLLEEAQSLARAGVKELILVAQETTLYGVDLYGRKCLHELISDLARIPGIRWIRLLYCYPEEIYDELIECMRTQPKFCHYLDLPIQHCNDRILKRMGRRTSRADLEQIIGRLRERIPDIALRTTLIAGFPSETPEEHEEMMQFVNDMEFDRLGVFPYSQEEDTPAAAMPDQVDEAVRQEWAQELMELQQEIAFDMAQERTGQTVTVMVEGKVADEEAYVCRTYADAPNVDGYLFLNTSEVLHSGDFARVRVTGACEYDLIGELEDEYEEAQD